MTVENRFCHKKNAFFLYFIIFVFLPFSRLCHKMRKEIKELINTFALNKYEFTCGNNNHLLSLFAAFR